MKLLPFLSAYDPNDAVGGSIDPLGFGQGYDALAEAFLPDITNAASRPRYFSMLCLGALLGEEVAPGDRVRRTREARMDCIMRLERFWALANVLSWGGDEHTEEGGDYPSGIRGLRYVERHAKQLKAEGARGCSADFPMLARQARYGVIGGYGAVAERLGLWDRKSLALKPDSGRALAEAFLSETKVPKSLRDAVKHDGEMDVAKLRQWGDRAHVYAETGPNEARCLRDALLRDAMRVRVVELLADHPEDDAKSPWVRELLRLERIGETARRRDETRDIAALIQAILVFEDAYRWCLLAFERALFACSQEPGGSVTFAALARDPVLPQVGEAMSEVCRRFEHALYELRGFELGGPVAPHLTDVFNFVQRLSTCGRDATGLVRALLARHADVQRGKYDRGQRKMPWLEERPGGVSLTLARWGRDRQDLRRPGEIAPHAYRTRSADALMRASHYRRGPPPGSRRRASPAARTAATTGGK